MNATLFLTALQTNETHLPACLGQVKIIGGQANVRLSCPFWASEYFLTWSFYIKIDVHVLPPSAITKHCSAHLPAKIVIYMKMHARETVTINSLMCKLIFFLFVQVVLELACPTGQVVNNFFCSTLGYTVDFFLLFLFKVVADQQKCV